MSVDNNALRQLIDQAAPVMAVLTIEDVDSAIPLARALVAGGVRVLEVTLRTQAAMEAIRAMQVVDGAIVGAGTVTRPQQLEQLARINAAFAVSPGITPALLDTAVNASIPLLPGIATCSELMQGMAAGWECFKFFPAAAAGGAAALKAFSGPFPHAYFCPTGGISPSNFRDYLALNNVGCVGGSWLAPQQAVAAGLWDSIEANARAVTDASGHS